jgi:hypothetical protein
MLGLRPSSRIQVAPSYPVIGSRRIERHFGRESYQSGVDQARLGTALYCAPDRDCFDLQSNRGEK